MARLRVLFIGKNTKHTFNPLFAVRKSHNLVGLVESDHLRPYKDEKSSLKESCLFLLRRIFKRPSLKSLAVSWNIPYFFLRKENEDQLDQFVKEINPDIICVATMSRLLKKEVFSIPKYGTINIHPSLLPKYRGAMPVFWELFDDEKIIGITIHYIDEGEDSGDIIAQAEFPIRWGGLYQDIERDIYAHSASLLSTVLQDISEGRFNRRSQPALSPTKRARKIKKGEILLDWKNWPIERAWNFLHGINNLSFFLPLPPPPFFPKHFSPDDWKVTKYEKRATSTSKDDAAKVFDKDHKGWFFCHPEGKIYLRYQIGILKIIKIFIRRLR